MGWENRSQDLKKAPKGAFFVSNCGCQKAGCKTFSLDRRRRNPSRNLRAVVVVFDNFVNLTFVITSMHSTECHNLKTKHPLTVPFDFAAKNVDQLSMNNQNDGYIPKRPKQLILASRTENENALLQRKLSSLAQSVTGGVRFSTTRPQATKLELGGHPDLVIFNFNDWNQNELKFVEDLRAEGYKNMIMILAKADAPSAVQNLQLLDRIVYLEKPYENRDLLGIAEKAITKGNVNQQVYRRFNTEQEALVEFEVGKSISSRIFNMSKTGAYLELNALQEVKIGDSIKLRMELENVNRTYVMPARIVWSQVMGRTGGTGIGVHFAGRGAVKRHIVQM